MMVARRAATALNEIDAVSADLAGLQDHVTGRVAIAAFPSAAAVLVPRALARLGNDHPGLIVEFGEASSPTQLRQLRAHRIDVAVVGVGPDLPAYDFEGLRRDLLLDGGLLLAVSVGHRFAGRRSVPVTELRDEPWIVGKGLRDDPSSVPGPHSTTHGSPTPPANGPLASASSPPVSVSPYSRSGRGCGPRRSPHRPRRRRRLARPGGRRRHGPRPLPEVTATVGHCATRRHSSVRRHDAHSWRQRTAGSVRPGSPLATPPFSIDLAGSFCSERPCPQGESEVVSAMRQSDTASVMASRAGPR